jgi:hypothetical protein
LKEAYISKLRITSKFFKHKLNALVFTISLSSSLKDSTKDILRGITLLNALTCFVEINLSIKYKA